MTTATESEAKVTDIEAAATARWLTKTLAHARLEALSGPNAEAVARIRTRVLGEAAAQKTVRRIAA